MEEIKNLEESEVKEEKVEEKKDNEIKINVTKHKEINEDDVIYLINAAKTMAINNGYFNLTKEVYIDQIEFVARTDKTRFTEDVKRAALHWLTK